MSAMRGYPTRGLPRLISTLSRMSSSGGPWVWFGYPTTVIIEYPKAKDQPGV
jgi:hypothetical protein